jgi:DnaJ-domain-containing protein 1
VLLENAFDVLLSMAYSDNIVSYAEQQLLAESASVFNLDKRTLDRLTARHHNWKTQFERKTTEKRNQSEKTEQNKQQSQKTNHQDSSQQKSKEDLSDFVKTFEESWSDILGVSKNATPVEVKKAYRKLVRAYHPDALPSDLPPEMMRSSVERFIEIQKAYEKYLRLTGKS